MSLLINDASRAALEAAVASQPHALLLTGKVGVGLLTIALEYAEKLGSIVIKVLPERNDEIDLNKGTITVESIRRLYDLTKTIEPGGRTIIIDYAERMGIPAQNAFLKLLEEPGEGTRFILLSHTPESLLPTITSRAQKIDIRPISQTQSEALLDELLVKDATKRTQLMFIASGLPAELTRLAKDETYFAARAEIVKDAHQLASGSSYQRLLLAKKYKDDRTKALILVEDAMKQLENTIAQGSYDVGFKVLEKLELLHKRLSQQGNIRLQLSSIVRL